MLGVSNSIKIRTKERIEELDIIRGYAIFGILVCNIVLFGYPQEYFSNYFSGNQSWLDELATYIRFNFFSDKTFTIFSLLFGIGIGMQYKKDPTRFPRYHIIRMFLLLMIGLFHAIIIWYGDILSLYSILGLLVLVIIHLRIKYLVIISILVFLWPTIQTILIRNEYLDFRFESYESLPSDQLIEMNTTHGLVGHFKYNFMQILPTLEFYLSFTLYQILSMIIVGIAIVKSDLLQTIHHDLNKYRILLGITGFMVLTWNLYYLLLFDLQKTSEPLGFYTYWALFNLSNIGQTFFVICALVLLYRSKTKWLQKIKVLKYLGRLSLTNYLLQSLLGIFIFKVLGFYGNSSPGVDMLLAIVLTIFQIILSKYWLERFGIGPIEGLWRKEAKNISTLNFTIRI